MSDSIKRLETLRNIYRAQRGEIFNPIEREIKELANEIKVTNDTKSMAQSEEITAATGSPYLKDQPYYSKDVVYNSPKETEWREVKTYEEAKRDVLVFKNLRKLNII